MPAYNRGDTLTVERLEAYVKRFGPLTCSQLCVKFHTDSRALYRVIERSLHLKSGIPVGYKTPHWHFVESPAGGSRYVGSSNTNGGLSEGEAQADH